MKNLYLILVLLIVSSVNAFSYELSAPIGAVSESTWNNFNPAKRHIQISMDVYNLDATAPYGAPQAIAQVKYWYIDNNGQNKTYTLLKDDHYPFGGPGSVGPLTDPGTGTPYTIINQLYIKVWRDASCQSGRSMAWARADLWW